MRVRVRVPNPNPTLIRHLVLELAGEWARGPGEEARELCLLAWLGVGVGVGLGMG